MKKHLLIGFVVLLVIFTSCTKESKVGPRGEKGETGLDGKDGIDGQDGKDGVTNLHVFTFSVPDSAWTEFGTTFTPGAYASYKFENTSITTEMIKEGSMMVYQDFANEITKPLPLSITLSGIQALLSYEAGPAFIKLNLIANDDGHYLPEENPANFRAVFIPKTARMLYPDLDYRNYSEVKETFNLTD